MTKQQFMSQMDAILNDTLDNGPGPHAVVAITTDALVNFIFTETGAYAPEAVEEVIERMHARVRNADNALSDAAV